MKLRRVVCGALWGAVIASDWLRFRESWSSNSLAKAKLLIVLSGNLCP
jgi:hypothetical protein